jgi:hypothetical protein
LTFNYFLIQYRQQQEENLMAAKRFPIQCPSCSHPLVVTRLQCDTCPTGVEGRFPFPPLARLDEEDQLFVLRFVRSSGNLKEMARLYSVSYPTVRNRLDALIERLESLEEPVVTDEGAKS